MGVWEVGEFSVHTLMREGVVLAILLQAPHCIDLVCRVPYVWSTARHFWMAPVVVPYDRFSWALHRGMSWSGHIERVSRGHSCRVPIPSKSKMGGIRPLHSCPGFKHADALVLHALCYQRECVHTRLEMIDIQ
jgi:hypothetical protein